MKNIKKIIAIILAAALALTCVLAIASCEKEKEYPDRRILEKDTVFSIDLLGSSVKNIPLMFLKRDSNVTLRKDGTGSLTLNVNDGVMALLNTVLEDANIGDVDLGVYLDMGYEYLPGLNLSDLTGTIRILKGTLGLTLLGVSPDDTAMQAFFGTVGETDKLPSSITLPENFGLQIDAPYYIKDVTSEYSGITYTGVYMGNHHEDGEPFFFMDIVVNPETGKRQIIIDYPIVDLYIVADEVIA